MSTSFDRGAPASRSAQHRAGYPRALVSVDHVEPVPRHVRATLGGEVVLDTTRALYLWEQPSYPQLQIPVEDVNPRALIEEHHTEPVSRGTVAHVGLRVASTTVTACPYKGTTSAYWSVQADETLHADLAWSYDFPTRELLPIAGLVAFYDEHVDVFLDGELEPRPRTHFSDAA